MLIDFSAKQQESKIKKIQEGDEKLREQLINEYKPFILKSVSKFCGKYIEMENDDEYSIGLIAFNEAIDEYNSEKGCSFIGFAGQVMKRRLIDYMRKNKNESNNTLTDFNETEGWPNMENIDVTQKGCDTMDISEEIISLGTELLKFGITFDELENCAPKHGDSRLMCIGVAQKIVDSPEMFSLMGKSGNLPTNQLAELVNLSKNTISKNKKYIITLCLILNSELDILKNYITETSRGGIYNG